MEVQLVLISLFSLLVGVLIGFVLFRNKKDSIEKEILQKENNDIHKNLEETSSSLQELKSELAVSIERVSNETSKIGGKEKEIDILKNEIKELELANGELLKENISYTESIKSFKEKLENQKKEVENIGDKFTNEFKVLADKILEEKSEKFTKQNQENLKLILDPLGENIKQFRTKVEETYNKESKERFSLAQEVKAMAELNKVISDEAKNLTQALKGEAKTQGNWGEMILESILEKSGLRKDEEYFMEHQLLDEEGKPLRSDSENKKMRPDAVIKYPDNRNVIIDSKVSLNAFTRYLSSTNKEEQDQELQMHVSAIKNHIVSLSTKGYDDYDKALDFVMMFIPSEPAYIAAMQGDSNLWNFAYDKRILLMNPTNLITSLKLIVDLWKREYQNQNAIEIANRGAKLYDKFVGFVSNLEGIGDYLEKAQGKYSDAYKQLTTGNDNLVLQAIKLKNLGLKTKKDLPKELQSAEGKDD